MQQRSFVARAHGARGARSALPTTLDGVFWETVLQVHRHGVRRALSFIRERAARAPAFGFNCSCAQLSLRLSFSDGLLSFCWLSPSLFPRLFFTPFTLRLSLPPRLFLALRLALSASASAFVSFLASASDCLVLGFICVFT